MTQPLTLAGRRMEELIFCPRLQVMELDLLFQESLIRLHYLAWLLVCDEAADDLLRL